jgi:hypothetical protein
LIRFVPEGRTDGEVTTSEFYPRYKALEWTSSLAGQDGVFLVRLCFCEWADDREQGKIIRENVNGTKEVIVYEHDVFYVHYPGRCVLTIAGEFNTNTL